jgi:hypothetical protein
MSLIAQKYFCFQHYPLMLISRKDDINHIAAEKKME